MGLSDSGRAPTKATPIKPERFHGYVMLPVATIVAIASMPGQSVIVAQFNTPIRTALDLSVAEISLSYTIGTLLASTTMMVFGKLADRFGLRAVVGVVAVLFFGATVAIGQARGFVTLTLGFLLIRALGQGALGMFPSHILAMWFERKLGMMDGIKNVCMSGSMAFIPAISAWTIAYAGWRLAMPIMGAVSAAAVLACVLTVFRNKPEDIGQHIDGDPGRDEPGHPEHDVQHGGTPPPGDPAFTLGEAARTHAFWILIAATAPLGLIGTAALFHMQPILESAGVTENVTAASAKAIAPWPITFATTLLVGGWLADRVHAKWLIAAGNLVTSLAAAIWYLGVANRYALSTTPTIALGMGVMGVGMALVVSAGPPAMARYFGRTHHGSIRGASVTATIAATAAGPLIAGWGYEVSGERFDEVMLGFTGMCLPLAVWALCLRKPEPPAR
ncbi:MAG: MFS transporter [Planctomycetota bacterium]